MIGSNTRPAAGLRVEVGVTVGVFVMVGSLVAVGDAVGVGVAVAVGVGVAVAVAVGKGSLAINTEPAELEPGALSPLVLPKLIGGLLAKSTGAEIVSPTPGWQTTEKVIAASVPVISAEKGGEGSKTEKSSSPSRSPPSNCTERTKAPDMLKTISSGIEFSSPSVGSKVRQSCA